MSKGKRIIYSLQQELDHFESLNINPTIRRELKAKIEKLKKGGK